MATLKELLEGDLNIGTSEKTASVHSSSKSAINDEIDKLALSLGFDFNKMAQEDEASKEDKAEYKKEDSKEYKKEDEKEENKKEASMSLAHLFNTLYPEDSQLNKTAAEVTKEAQEEAIGARAFEHFNERFSNRMAKVASELKTSTGTGKSTGEDASFPQQIPNDACAKDQNAIGTDKKEGGEEAMNKAERGAAASGNFEGDKLAMAMRKLMIQNSIK